MKCWKVKVFDVDDNLLKEKVVKSDSKFYVKNFCKRFVENTDSAESYSYKEINEDHVRNKR